jgi:hypothetical protein
MKFLVGLGPSGSPSWWLYGSNDEMLAWAGRYFASLEYAQRSALAFKSSAAAAKFEVYPYGDGGWRWRTLQYIDYYMAYSPGSFNEAAHARRAARNIAKGVSRAAGP